MFAKSVDRPFGGVYIFPRPESVAHKPAAFQLEFKLAASFVFFSPLSLEFSFGAMHKAQVVCAWVTLGGGWSKFQVQSQQTATVLRWRNLPPPVLWVYIFDWSHNFHIQIKCFRHSRCIIYHFSVSPALSKCETIFKKWGILLQRAHVRFPAKVHWLWLENTWVTSGVTVWPSFFFFFFLAAIFFLFQGRVGAYLLQRPTKTRGQTHQGLQRNVKQVRVTLSFVSFVFNMTSSWDWLPCAVQE